MYRIWHSETKSMKTPEEIQAYDEANRPRPRTAFTTSPVMDAKGNRYSAHGATSKYRREYFKKHGHYPANN